MRRLFAFLSFLAAASAMAFGADEGEGEGQWMMHYYKHPEPNAIAAKLPMWLEQGLLKKKETQPVMIGFVLRLMHDNPGKAMEWLQIAESFPPLDRQTIRIAAWYSKVPAAKDYLDFKNLREFAHHDPPDVDSLPVDTPASVDFNWAIYYASGDPAALRRIIGVFRFGRDFGAADRFATSQQTGADRQAASNDETFRAAKRSLTSNCEQDETTYGICKRFLISGNLSEIEHAALRQSLGTVKPDDADLRAEDARIESSKPAK